MRIKPSRLLAVMACGLAANTYAAPAYQFTDLGMGMGMAINNLGQVAGSIDISTPDDYYSHAALFSGGKVIDLGTLGGKANASSYATSINDAGEVAGWSYVPSTFVDPRGHVYGYTSFVYKNGQMTALTPDESNQASAINNHGQVAVTYGDLSVYTDSDTRASYIHDQGLRTQIKNPVGPIAPIGVNALNDQGQATGDLRTINSDSIGASLQHAYRYSNGVTTDLGTLGGANSVGNAINQLGQVVGNADYDPKQSGATHAFLYDNGHMTDLGTLGGMSSQGLGINDLGQVVGYSTVSTRFAPVEAFLYSNGQMISLQKLMAPVIGPGWSLSEATGINARGDITGWGLYNGVTHAFLLTAAVPEPDVVALVLAGLTCVGLRVLPGRRPKRGAQAGDKARASAANATA
ncbi:MAG: hypothetical protein QM749_14490 [Aquabacterium sp.]